MSGLKFTQVWVPKIFNKVAYAAFPASTAFYLSAVTGIPQRTAEKHLRGENKPSANHVLAYLGAGQFGKILFAEMMNGGRHNVGNHLHSLRHHLG